MRRLRKLARKGRWLPRDGSPPSEPPPSERPFETPSLATVGGSRLKTTLLYVENGVGLNPAIGAAAGYVFNLNSLHDPNTSWTSAGV